MLSRFCFSQFWNPSFFLPQKARVFARLILFWFQKSAGLLAPSFLSFPEARVFSTRSYLLQKTRGFSRPILSVSARMRGFLTRSFYWIQKARVFTTRPLSQLVLSEYKKQVVFYHKKRVFYYKKQKNKKQFKILFFFFVFLVFYIFLCTKQCFELFFTFFMVDYMKTILNCPSHTLCYCW